MSTTLRLSRRSAVQGGLAGFAAFTSLNVLAHAQDSATPAPPPDSITPEGVARAVDALDGIATDALDATGVPGLSIAVVYRDEVLATRGYGVASTESGDPVDADTVFQIASLSKPFASTVVASIVGDGLVTWDTPVVEHLPWFRLHDPYTTANVTLRDMFSHRSGLPGHAGDVLEDIGYDRDEILHRLRYLPLAATLRGAYAYTNFGLTAAAVSASAADGMTWEDACDARLYRPLGMSRTSSRFDDYTAADNRALTHVREGDVWLPKYVRNPDPQSPAGGVSSTANDMAQWLRLQLGGGTVDGTEIVPAGPLGETHRPQMISEPPADPAVDHASLYGLGWNVGYDNDGTVRLSHSGAFGLGTGTAVTMLPNDELGIVALTNGMPIGVAEAMTFSFIDIVRTGSVQFDYVAALGPIFAEITAPQYGAVDYTVPPSEALPPQSLDSYTGTYTNEYVGPVDIVQDGDRLMLSQGPRPDSYPLDHWNRDTFTYLPIGENQNFTSGVTFTIGPDGIAERVTIEALDTKGMGTLERVTEQVQ